VEFDINIRDETLKAKFDLDVCGAIEKRGSRLIAEMGLGYQGFPSAEFFITNSSQSAALMKIVLEEVLIAGGNNIISTSSPPKMVGGKRLHIKEKGELVKDVFARCVESGKTLQVLGAIMSNAYRDSMKPKPTVVESTAESDGPGDIAE